MLKRLLSTVLLITATSLAALAQQGSLKGKIVDGETGEPVPFVNVAVKMNGVLQAGGATDFDGVFFIKPITPGTYTVEASATGMKTVQISGVGIRSDKITPLDIKMSANVEMLGAVDVIAYKVPVFEKDQTVVSTTVTKDELVKMPARGVEAIAATAGGVYSSDDGTGDLNIRGARSDANYVFIDGIKVRGSNNLPQGAVEEISVITGGLPAQYGDVTGGVISITTRGPSAEYFGSVEYVTSGFPDSPFKLDNYGYNLLEASVSGPLLMKKDSLGNKTKEPIVGFFLAGNFTSIIDPRPSAIGTWRIKDDALDQLKADPIRIGTGTQGTLQNAEFLRMNSFEKVETRENAAQTGFVLNGKLDFSTGKNTNLTFGGSIDWQRRNEYQYDYALFNYENNPLVTENTWRVFGRFTQRLGGGNDAIDSEESASTIKNAFYTVQLDYSEDNYRRESEQHKDNLFAYGHYGKFTRYQERQLEFQNDTIFSGSGNDRVPVYVGRANVQTLFADTLIGFRASSLNPDAAQYTQSYYELYGWQGYDDQGNPQFDPDQATNDENGNGNIDDEEVNFYLRNFENIRANGGLINGDLARTPDQVYNIWDNHAYTWNRFQRSNTSQFRITAMGSADIKNHAISIGFEYEQRVDRGYSVSPVGLWTTGNQLANSHISEIDDTNPIFVEDESNTYPTVIYNRLNSSEGAFRGDADQSETQSFLDYNIRRANGWNTDGTDFIDFHALDPEQLKIDYFSANELLNGGNELVYYYGYDVHGNRTSDNPSIDDFFTATDEYNNYTRPIGAFRPTYVAGYIQDKFAFDDLIFNIGLRVDRYDANQSVLKDKYVLFPTVKAGEQAVQDLIAENSLNYSVPGNIGDNYVVYVDNVEDPSSIVGYRNDDTWYNADGIEIQDASILAGSNSTAQPFLVDPENNQSIDITSASFEDYTPQVNFMPRISFSFPISEEATFFAHYDVLTKRPTAGGDLVNYARLNPLDYYFMNQRTATDIIANPDLKPEKTIDYSVGFKQKITDRSSISIEAFYRELRDLIQVVGVQQAYPKTYTTFDNIDFGTVKGLTFSYDMRRTGNISMRAAYTLQFAEGTGSNTQSALNLVRAGLQNLRSSTPLNYDQRHTIVATVDYRYGGSADPNRKYQGPVIGDFKVLENTGANFQFNLGSGTPYSKQLIATGTRINGGGGSPLLDGSVNGSRLPWQFRVDLRLDRDIPLKVGKGENKRNMSLNVYLQMLNVLNSLNSVIVYRATGSSDDDGYLTEPVREQQISTQNDPQSFRELYTMNMQDYRYYSLPRRTRIGFILNF